MYSLKSKSPNSSYLFLLLSTTIINAIFQVHAVIVVVYYATEEVKILEGFILQSNISNVL